MAFAPAIGVVVSSPVVETALGIAVHFSAQFAVNYLTGGIFAGPGHRKNRREGNREKHEKGDARRQRDQRRSRERKKLMFPSTGAEDELETLENVIGQSLNELLQVA